MKAETRPSNHSRARPHDDCHAFPAPRMHLCSDRSSRKWRLAAVDEIAIDCPECWRRGWGHSNATARRLPSDCRASETRSNRNPRRARCLSWHRLCLWGGPRSMNSPQVLFVCHDAGGTIPPVLAVARGARRAWFSGVDPQPTVGSAAGQALGLRLLRVLEPRRLRPRPARSSPSCHSRSQRSPVPTSANLLRDP